MFTLLQTTNVFAQNNVGYGISFAPLVEKLIGGVVNISTTHSNKNAETKPEIISANEFINNYFVQDEGGYISLGSGFLIDPQGYIVTNAHVIDKANEVVVKTSDNIQYNAKIIGIDDMTDLALIKIDADKQFPFVKIDSLTSDVSYLGISSQKKEKLSDIGTKTTYSSNALSLNFPVST